MKVCMAATYSRDFLAPEFARSRYLLESFWYYKDWQKPLFDTCETFMIDSGAFTFMNTVGGNVDWSEYLDRYIAFIREHEVRQFFELDVDSIIGYDAVKKLRARLESGVGRPSIPVWHKSRGIDEFRKMCDEYDYVAIGGIVSKEIPISEYKALPALIREAHKMGTRVHGLGFTNLGALPRTHFDSVDSTAWLAGSRFGMAYRFNGHGLDVVRAAPGRKTVHYKDLDRNNVCEWIKFQDYASTAL